MTVTARLVKNQKVPWRIIEEEAILIDLDEGELVRLNPVGAEIWNSIDGQRTLEDIVEHLCHTFEVTQRKARKDAAQFIKHLLRHELVQEITEPAPNG